VKLVQRNFNPALAIEGVLLTMYDARLNLCKQVAEEAKEYFGGRMFNVTIPRNVRLAEAPSFPGCLMEVRPIGVLRMIDQGEGDEKILAVVESDPLYREVQNIDQVFDHTLRGIEHFFSVYKALEKKKTEIAGWGNAEAARKIIQEGRERFK